ncbi:MAG TPA: hypothetical protein VJU14_05595 [Solirubrobacterales bacterium]|nr:hypothetical protein [Solirubrobacterales bacterium]
MFHRIREPFGKAGLIVAVVALVAALVGGAYAANGLTGKQKKEVKKIAKKFAGKDGAQGPAGQNGPPGAKGDTGAAGANGAPGADGEDGTDGTNGTNGTDGEDVTIIPLDPGDTNCPGGGSKFINGTGEGFACSGGSEGSYPEFLPEGRTATGLWENQAESGFTLGEFSVTTISFPLPLETAPAEVVFFDPSDHTEEEELKCPGGGFEPKATPGVLCLYLINGEPEVKVPLPQQFGAIVYFDKTKGASFGSWAVMPAEAAE